MSQKEKMLRRILSIPSDYTYDELARFLSQFGFQEMTGGKTGGSRRRFFRDSDSAIIFLHKPHPENIVNKSTIRDVIAKLRELGDIDE